MIIERIQKQYLIEEAARLGVTTKRIQDIPEFYQQLLGQTDVGVQRLGSPLSSVYRAVDGEMVDVQRMAKYFQGLLRDVRVLDTSITTLENNLLMLGLQFWNRTQLTKNRAKEVRVAAESEKTRAEYGARWTFSESFSTTQYIDMQRTTAWIDTSQGLVFLPNQGDDQTVLPQTITVESETQPEGGSFLGSSAQHAFDGLETTNWRALFTKNDTTAQTVIKFPMANINSMQVDPVGYGITLNVDYQSEGGWKPLVRDTFYAKKTLVFEAFKVERLRFTYMPLENSLPRTAGIRSISLFSSQPVLKAQFFTTNLKSQYAFNEIKLDLTAAIPSTSKVTMYVATASGGPWTQFKTGDWHPITRSVTTNQQFSAGNLTQTGALYVRNLQQPAINNIQGRLYVGINQVEVSAFRRDWSADSESPRVLQPQDFKNNTIIKTWTTPVKYAQYQSAYPRLWQGYGLSTLSTSPTFLTRGRNLIGLRKTNDYQYTEMSIVPLTGNRTKNCLQPNYNYRFRTWVHCARDSFFDQGRYWFLQGHRTPGTRTYKDLSRAYGAVAMYANNRLVFSDTMPKTVYTDNSMEQGASEGISFSLKLSSGWNVLDLYLNVIDTSVLPPDNNNVGDPYLQFTMTPSVFDADWQQTQAISQVLASGVHPAVGEFDLNWTLPKDPTYWAWTDDRQGLLFNTNSVKSIDGFFRGVFPLSQVSYMGVNVNQAIPDLYLRGDLERSEQSLAGPVPDAFKLFVR